MDYVVRFCRQNRQRLILSNEMPKYKWLFMDHGILGKSVLMHATLVHIGS